MVFGLGFVLYGGLLRFLICVVDDCSLQVWVVWL